MIFVRIRICACSESGAKLARLNPWCQAPGYLHAPWHEGVSLPTTTRWPGVWEEKKGFVSGRPGSTSAKRPRIAGCLEPRAGDRAAAPSRAPGSRPSEGSWLTSWDILR